MYKENFITKPNPHCRRCGVLIGLICLGLVMCFAVYTTYLITRYVPAFNQQCPSIPPSTDNPFKSTTMDAGSNTTQGDSITSPMKSTPNIPTEFVSTSEGGPKSSFLVTSPTVISYSSYSSTVNRDEANSSLGPAERFSILLQHYNLTDCRLEIEASAQQWINESQNTFHEYLNDDNKTLNCTDISLVPPVVLQKALVAYHSIKNICRIEEQVDGERKIQMNVVITTNSAMAYRRRVMDCADRLYCAPSEPVETSIILRFNVFTPKLDKATKTFRNTLLLTYINRNERVEIQYPTGKPTNPKHLTSELPFRLTHTQARITCFTNGTLYVAGIGPMNRQIWKWSQDTEEWSRLADMPMGRVGHSVICIGNAIFVLAGTATDYYHNPYHQSSFNNSNPILRYDIDNNTWAEVSKLNTNVDNAICVSYKHLIYIFGGAQMYHQKSRPLIIQIYDTENDTATTSPNTLSKAMYYHRATVWGSKALLFNNYGHDVYNLDLDLWEKGQNYSIEGVFEDRGHQWTAAVAVDDNTLYAISSFYNIRGQIRPFYELKAVKLADPVSSDLQNGWKNISLDVNLGIRQLLALYPVPCKSSKNL